MTRKRRYLISAAVLAACVGIALGVLVVLPPRPGVTKANFDRIEKGMNWKQVQEIFGEESFRDCFRKDGYTDGFWIHSDAPHVAQITFCNDVVTEMNWGESAETIPDKLRRWLHLPPAE